ncbi:MAG: hypothetical protein AAF668_02175 [Pseudomonadota bacterium]
MRAAKNIFQALVVNCVRSSTLIAVAFSTVLLSPAHAQEQNRFAVGVNAGTLGVGLDVQVRATNWLVLRGGGHFADINIDREFDGIDYSADVGLSNGMATVDIHPFGNAFFISGGGVFGPKTIDLAATPAEPTQIGDQVFTPEQIGSLVGSVEADTAAPFVGLGFDNAVLRSGRVGVSFLAGVAFTGEPSVALAAVGGILESDPIFLDALADEQDQLEDDVRDFQYLPVVRLGLTIGF